MPGFSLNTLLRRAARRKPTSYVADVRDRGAITDQPWETACRNKREDLRARIREDWLLREELPDKATTRDFTGDFVRLTLSAREVEITETEVFEILQKTTAGEWTAREVAEAFCHRAAVAHQLVNCLHEIFFEAALRDADALDEYFKKHGRPIGPLHGLPISLKDQFHVKGVDTSMGYVGWLGTFEGQSDDPRHLTFESQLVTDLRALGAILYCKTACPPTLMCPETVNNIVGYVDNPRNRLLTAGGSSGGEGALMALRGSVAGFGSDIGGSVRIPAAFNGAYGLRPSTGRLPYAGVAQPQVGKLGLPSVVGPLATSAEGLQVLVEAALSRRPWLHDPAVVPLPWRADACLAVQAKIERRRGQRLAIGVLAHDGAVRPQPPVRRALRLVAGLLERDGHAVVDWAPPPHRTARKLASAFYSFDAGADARRQLARSGEPAPAQLRSVLHKKNAEYTASKMLRTQDEKLAFQKEYLDYWNASAQRTGSGEPVDAFLSPVAPYACARPGHFDHVDYTIAINTLDYSAVAFPVTQADRLLDARAEPEPYVPLSPADEQCYRDCEAPLLPFSPFHLSQHEHMAMTAALTPLSDDLEVYHGAPVGLQLVGRRYEEEKLITLVRYLSTRIKEMHQGPATDAGIALEPQLPAGVGEGAAASVVP
ncbi:Acetamidase [Ascosphaera acerosa]|nr:Acetamidase [Ascosphaera acerosa]